MKPKIVKIPVLDAETGEIIQLEVDQEYLDFEEKEQEKIKKLRELAYEEERRKWDFLPND